MAIVVAAPSAAHTTKRWAHSATFADPVGDNGSNPDIAQVTVSNDNAGLLTLAIAISNRSELAASEFVTAFLNTDSDSATGDRDGMDHAFSFGASAGPGVAARWTGPGSGFGGSGWTTILGSPSFSASWAGGPRFTISQAELGDTPHFFFYAIAGLANTPPQDDAPDGSDLWNYRLDIPLMVKGFALQPKLPQAGKVFRARIQVRTNTIEARPITCQARLGGKPLPGRGSWFSIATVRLATTYEAVITCEWQLPRKARGKRFAGSISATNDGVTVTRAFSNRVR